MCFRWFCAAAFAAWSSAVSAQAADSIVQIRDTMAQVEDLLQAQGIEVTGYANSEIPAVEFVDAANPYLQGNDGGFAGGTLYVNNDAIADCVDLILIHELVHDATVKHRLFAGVPLGELKDAIEALADAVTAEAAEKPYRPGCLPHRRFALSGPELTKLALSQAAP